MERDPYLRRNDGLKNGTNNNSGNDWAVAMKDVPSYSEHMERMNGNAITKATNVRANETKTNNAITKASHNSNMQQPVIQNHLSKPFKR